MKKKISRILGVGLTVALLASLLVIAAPVSAGTLSFSEETPSKDLKARVDNILAPAGLDIVDLAVSGDTIYAATNDVLNPLYKSTNGGKSWSNLYTTTSFPQGNIIKAVALATGKPEVVAIVTSNNTVVYSSNAGSSWTGLSMAPNVTVHAIDVSPDGTLIAAGSTNATGGGDLLTFKLELAQLWTPRAGATGFTAGQTAIRAVKFSPNFTSDKIITVVSGSTTNATFQAFRYETGAWTWNGAITFFGADWATGLDLGGITGGLAAAGIALPSTFRGTEAGDRSAFVAFAGATTGGGVVRLSDTFQKGFTTWSAGDEGPIGSIAYHESGKLLAGDFDLNQVYRSLEPMASSPKFDRITTLKQPGGVNNTIVAWSGTNAVAATSGDESAFAISTDDGNAFNDISLIDTELDVMVDVAVSADGSKYYLTSHDTSEGGAAWDTSVWVRDTAWARVYSSRNVADANAPYLVRIAPDDAATVYISSKGTNNMWVSKNSGKTSWKNIPDYRLTQILDFAVQSTDIVYAIDNGGVSKTSDAGVNWGSKKNPIDAFVPYMISLAPNKDILVGGSDGYAAFSKDGGATFSRTQAVVTTGVLNVHVVADDGYATNNIIYAGAGTSVKRGKADTTTTFTSRSPAIDSTQSVKGIGELGGVIYVVTSNATDSAVFRSLNLEIAESDTTDIWSSATTGYEFEATPKALVISTGGKLWAIDTANSLIDYSDAIAATAPTLTSPAAVATVATNPATGQAYNVTFTFKRQSSKVTAIQLQIATDSKFTGIVYEDTYAGITTDIIAKTIGPTAQIMSDFMPGTDYYWRVRTTAPLYSPWSKANTFSVASVVSFALTGPATGVTGVSTEPTFTWTPFAGAIGYEIMVSTDAKFAIIEYSHNVPVDTTFYKSEPLSYNTTYYWRVRGVTGPAPAKKAAPGGPWAIGIFTTMAEPVPPKEAAPTVIIQKEPAPPPTVIEVPVQTVVPQPIPSYLLWIIIVIGAVLVIALIVLIVRTRRVA